MLRFESEYLSVEVGKMILSHDDVAVLVLFQYSQH